MTFSKLGTDIDTGQIVELSQASRRQGLYIIGANGTGKTGLIEHLILQDIDQGLGVGLLDPHGDLVNAILAKMTKREEDVILLDIQDEDHPFGLNIFECPNPQSPTAVQKIVDLVMHIFEKLYDVSRQTPRMAQFLRNCTHTLVANPGYTMADIPLLLQDDQCRSKLVAQVKDPQVQLFWKTYNALMFEAHAYNQFADMAKEARLRPGDRAMMRGALQQQTVELGNNETTTVNYFSVTYIEVLSRSKRTSITAYEQGKST